MTGTRILPPSPYASMHIARREPDIGRFWWNVARVLRFEQRLDLGRCALATAQLSQTHEALRLRIERSANGYLYRFAECADSESFQTVYRKLKSEDEVDDEIRRYAQAAQRNIDLVHGPTYFVTLFDFGQTWDQRLLLLFSHCVCDGYSLDLITHDFYRLYGSDADGIVDTSHVGGTPYSDWYLARSEYSGTSDFRSELKYWYSLPYDQIKALPTDFENPRLTTRKSVVWGECSLSAERTTRSLQCLRVTPRPTVEEVLLGVLGQVLISWSASTIHGIYVVNSGRLGAMPGERLRRTVGNLMSQPKLVLDLGGSRSVLDCIIRTRDQLRCLPDNGRMWEWLPPDLIASSEVAFNFVGYGGGRAPQLQEAWAQIAKLDLGPLEDPEGDHWAALVWTARIRDRSLSISVGGSRNLYRDETLDMLARAFIEMFESIAD